MDESGVRTVVITGASSGIGRELALKLAASGGRFWIVARSGAALEELAEEMRGRGAEVLPVVLDLADLERSGEVLRGILEAGPVDEVYLSAAVSIFGEVTDIRPEDWDRIYRVDLVAHLQWFHGIYAAMVKRGMGRLVMISSLSGYAGYPTSVPYATMKAGLLGLFRTIRHEAPRYGVKVHLVSPGYVKTDIYEKAIYRGSDRDKTLKQIEEMGFRMIGPDLAADLIIKGVAEDRDEILFPRYASLLAWMAPRMPWLVKWIHRRMVKRFRELKS